MKSWIKKSLYTVFGASIALGGLTACSSARPWHHDASPEQMAQMQGKMVERIGSKLELDAAQKAKLETLADALLAQRQALRGGMSGSPRDALKPLIAGELDKDLTKASRDDIEKHVAALVPL